MRGITPTLRSITELELLHQPTMVNEIQLSFDPSRTCVVDGCYQHGFIRCIHCGKILCMHHFLNRTCFHSYPKQHNEPDIETVMDMYVIVLSTIFCSYIISLQDMMISHSQAHNHV